MTGGEGEVARSAAGTPRGRPAQAVTDAHVHLLPGRLGEAVRAFFDERIPGRLAYPNDHPAVLESLAAQGITRVWNLPYAHRGQVAEGLNAASARLATALSGHGPEIVPGATVHPSDDDPAATVGRALDEHGARVLKLHCSVGDFDLDDPRLDGVWRLLALHRAPVVVHAGHDVTGLTAAHELEAVAAVARAHPHAPIIIAHAAHPDTHRAVELVDAFDNVHLDLTPRVVDLVDLPDAALEKYCERVLFGSDAPNTAVPVERALARLDGLSPHARAQITSGTAGRLVP